MITPRPSKTHGVKGGEKGKVEGKYEAGQRVLVVDDLITRAHTKLESIGILEAHGLKVVGVLMLVDREQGGVQKLEAAGYKVRTIYKASELLDFGVRLGEISPERREEALAYIRENA